MDDLQAALASVPGSVRDHFSVSPCRHHAVNERPLEGPHPVHAFGGHQFGVNVLVAPAGSHGDDVVVAGGASVNVVHQVHLLVKFGVANIEDGAPVGLVLNDRHLGQRFGALAWRTTSCNRFGQTSGGFDLVGKRSEIRRGMNAPGTVGKDPEGHAEFLSGNGTLENTITHRNGGFGEGHDTDLGITGAVSGGGVQSFPHFVLVEVPSGCRAMSVVLLRCHDHALCTTKEPFNPPINGEMNFGRRPSRYGRPRTRFDGRLTTLQGQHPKDEYPL